MVQYAMGVFPRVKFGPDRRRCLVQEPPKLKIWSIIAVFRCFSALQDDYVYDVKVKFVLKVYTVGSLSHDKFESYLQGVSTEAPKTKSGQKRVFCFFHPAM